MRRIGEEATHRLLRVPGLHDRAVERVHHQVERARHASELGVRAGGLQAAGRVMTAQRRGSIVIFSSIRARVVEAGQSVYAATKAGIVQMVRAAAAEFGPSGVRVNAVGPGVVETPLTAPIIGNREWYDAYAAKSVFKRWATADEMVGPTLFLASDAASYVTGTLLLADGGWTATDGRFTPPGMTP